MAITSQFDLTRFYDAIIHNPELGFLLRNSRSINILLLFLILNMKLLWKWFRPGSNRGPFACKANVITTTLRNLTKTAIRLVLKSMYHLSYRKSHHWCISKLYKAVARLKFLEEGGELQKPQFSREKIGRETQPRKNISRTLLQDCSQEEKGLHWFLHYCFFNSP